MPESRIVFRHALRIAVIPAIAILAVGLGSILSRALFVEATCDVHPDGESDGASGDFVFMCFQPLVAAHDSGIKPLILADGHPDPVKFA